MTPLWRPSPPSSTLHSLQVTSGLFDTGFTDLSADRSVNSNICESDDAISEMLSSIGNADDLLDDLPSSFELDSSFNEVFTDLSAFIPQDINSVELTSPAVVTADSTTLAKPAKRGSKRKAPSASPQLADHSSYATKRPRVEIAPTSSEEVTSTAPPILKEVKYRQRRDKNNLASKRSRETRKQKYVDMEAKASQLEQDNAELRTKVTELERLTKQMKDMLVQKLAKAM